MVKHHSIIALLAVSVFAFMFVGCSNTYRDIPPGYVGKVLTPSGWQDKIFEAGQVDIGTVSDNGSSKSLCLLEATTWAAKESFGQHSSEDNEDHRIVINRAPVTVDVRLRLLCPTDPERRNAIFGAITAKGNGQDRVSTITLKDVYEKFAQMDVRSIVHARIQQETDVYWVMSHLLEMNKVLTAMVIDYFKKTGVPLDVQDVAVSNIKPDEKVWDAANAQAAALAQIATIDSVGRALERHPEYLKFKSLEVYKDVALSDKNKGNINWFINAPTSTSIAVPTK